MNKFWTLHVEKFAKIQEADVRVSPLMCFVGDNNSGKSYLMSLLWGILTLGKDLFPKTPSENKKYKACEQWLTDHKNQDTEMQPEDIQIYIDWFNELLTVNKKALTRKIFNYEIEIGAIKICDYQRKSSLSIQWKTESERYSVTEKYFNFPLNDSYTRDDLLNMNAYICWNILMEGLAAPLYTPIIKGRRTGEPVYLPASRTGFMLTYPQLIEKSLQISFSQDTQASSSLLTLPYVDFLQLITKFESKTKISKKYLAPVAFIEEQMTKGNLNVKKDMIPVIKYQPMGSKTEMPLYVASSIVAEISPLLLLLKSDISFKTLIIEEPEAHLHPALQKKMAQLIIHLIHIGIPVWITTHSDTILQHINNMLQLESNQNKKELMQQYEYTEEDLITISDIRMYQFEQSGKGSKLVELEQSKYGFVVPTFNDALENIVDEVYAFQED